MKSNECIQRLSKFLFWDADMSNADMDEYPAFFIQRVLEYGTIDDWRLIRSYYGLEKIVEVCKTLRTLDPMSLSYICTISQTNKEDYRCYHTMQSHPTLWNS